MCHLIEVWKIVKTPHTHTQDGYGESRTFVLVTFYKPSCVFDQLTFMALWAPSVLRFSFRLS